MILLTVKGMDVRCEMTTLDCHANERRANECEDQSARAVVK